MKKIIFILLAAVNIFTHCYSQDIITKKTGDEVQAIVLEITQSEIKFKKFDNQNGPTYTIFKSDVLMIRYENGTKDIFTEIEQKKSEVRVGKVYFLRSTGWNGSAVAFTVFIDDSLACKLNNKCYSIHDVNPAEHKFTVQFAGKDSKVGAEPIKINIESGKTYYIQLIFQPGFAVNNIYCQEVTEKSAKTILPKLKEDTKCY